VNDFIWCDLSAYEPDNAATFYADVLGWRVEQGAYRFAFCGDEPVAALFEMPEFFRRIEMPSFWMSYIQVPSVQKAVEAAKAHGGKVELEDSFEEDGRIALIRDPLGAGFTVYEGTMQAGAFGFARSGLRAAHDLHISDIGAVEGFYRAVFGWTVERGGGEAAYFASATQPVARIHETSDAARGGFQYWGITFTVADLNAAARMIESSGGMLYPEMTHAGRRVLSGADSEGAAFFLTEAGAKADNE